MVRRRFLSHYRWALGLCLCHLPIRPWAVLGLLGLHADREQSGSWPDSDAPIVMLTLHDSSCGSSGEAILFDRLVVHFEDGTFRN